MLILYPILLTTFLRAEISCSGQTQVDLASDTGPSIKPKSIYDCTFNEFRLDFGRFFASKWLFYSTEPYFGANPHVRLVLDTCVQMKVACTVTTYVLGYNKSFLYRDTVAHACTFVLESSNYEN